MQRLRTWTQGHVEVLRAWQRRSPERFAAGPRLTTLYRALTALPKAQQTQWRRRCKATLWGVALCLAASDYQPGWADTITVDGSCTLVDAITTANTDTTTGNCTHTGTNGADTIALTVDTTLTTSNNTTFGPTGLPVISSMITITGNGHTITRDQGNPDIFRLLAINNTGDLTLKDTTLSGGTAAGNDETVTPTILGGGILNHFGQLRLEGCTVSDNSAVWGGGVVVSASYGGTVSLVNNTISGNSASFGGGVYNRTFRNSTVSLVNSTLSGNSASGNGGGMFSQTYGSSTVSLVNSTVSGNSASLGGGVSSLTRHASTVSLVNSTVSGNSGYWGGVYSLTQDVSTVSLVNSTISGNSGGGVCSRTQDVSTVSLVNSTVSGNSSGGVFGFTQDESMVSLVNSTVSGNSGYWGGVYSLTQDVSTVALHRSLIAGNTVIAGNAAFFLGSEVTWINYGGSFLANDMNLFGHSGITTTEAFYGVSVGVTDILATADGGNSTALTDILDPALANNGGPTLTHALVTDSPAIDAAGDCSPLGTDQRGVARPQGLACDIGAFELSETVSETCGNCVDDDGDGLVDFTDPDCPAPPMTKERASFSLNAPVQTDQLTLTATLPGGGLVNPLLDGVNVQFVDGNGVLLCLALPPAVTAPGAWSTKVSGSGKTTWTFKDAADGHLGAPSKDKGSVAYDPGKNTTTVKLMIRKTEIGGDATARNITTAVTIGPSTWQKVQAWQPKAKGKKLVTP